VIVATPRSFGQMVGFNAIKERAEQRKGGASALARLLPPRPDLRVIADLPNDRILAEMTKRVFSAGFAWSVIDAK
jgi:3-methyladenine DNA glycosylase Tag